MRIFKTKLFTRDARTERLTDETLKTAIKEIGQGLIDAYLGGNLIKKRIAIGSKGKSGGICTVLAHKGPTGNIFCIYVFAKNEIDNISAKQLRELKLLAKFLLSKGLKELEAALDSGELVEVIDRGN
jgi:hypothetical protein